MKTYSEKLRDPRWQRKRLEIMQRDGFTCVSCRDATSTLNVHHCYYLPKTNPWEYNDNAMVTLCENCHQEQTFRIPALMLHNKTPHTTMINTELLRCASGSERTMGIVMEIAFGLSVLDSGDHDGFVNVVAHVINNLNQMAYPPKSAFDTLIDNAPEI